MLAVCLALTSTICNILTESILVLAYVMLIGFVNGCVWIITVYQGSMRRTHEEEQDFEEAWSQQACCKVDQGPKLATFVKTVSSWIKVINGLAEISHHTWHSKTSKLKVYWALSTLTQEVPDSKVSHFCRVDRRKSLCEQLAKNDTHAA